MEKLEKIDPNLRSNPESIAILAQMRKIRDELKKADPIKHEELHLILKCECGKTMEIPPDLQMKLDAEEDITGIIPNCDCGKAYLISVTN